MAKKRFQQPKLFVEKLLRQVYKIEYLIESYAKYSLHVLSGGTSNSRISKYTNSNYIGNKPNGASYSRLALFVAYHPNQAPPASNINYLKALLKNEFRTIYIHNGPLNFGEIELLKPYCEQVLCRQNIGQDFGAWKDGYLYCESKKLLENVEWLLLCNDSNLFLGGEHGTSFSNRFENELINENNDLIALSRNYEFKPHYQSYFLCFHSRLFSSSGFKQFWLNYLPLSHRFHAINNGEMALSRKVIQSTPTAILYDSLKLYAAIQSRSASLGDVLENVPQNALKNLLKKEYKPDSIIDSIYLNQIIAYLDCHNPSHAYALLWVKYLKCPFLKKDLFRHGVFTLQQIITLLKAEDLQGGGDFQEMVINNYKSTGSNISYINFPRAALRKGVPSITSPTFHGHGYKLERSE